MSEVVREDIKASVEDVYRAGLEEKLRPIRLKPWSELSPEEKETVQEWLAYKAGVTAVPK